MCLGIFPSFKRERAYSAVSMRSWMLWMDRSSDPTMNMARASAFFASLAAKLSSNLGELRLRKICRYKDSTRFWCLESTAVAHIRPFMSMYSSSQRVLLRQQWSTVGGVRRTIDSSGDVSEAVAAAAATWLVQTADVLLLIWKNIIQKRTRFRHEGSFESASRFESVYTPVSVFLKVPAG